MKCPHCHALSIAGDEFCSGCGKSLLEVRQADAKAAAKPATPPWAYVFAVACGAIPFVTLGGAIPGAIGFGGAGACLAVSRTRGVATPVRILACLGITIVCWLGLITFLIELNPAIKAQFHRALHR